MTNATDAKMRTGSLPALPPKIHLDEDIEMKDDTERNSAQIHDDDTDASNEGLQSEESSFKDGTDCDTHDVSQLSTDPCSIEIASAQGSFSEKAKDASTNQRIHPVRRDSRSRHDETNSVDRGWESTSYRSKDPEPVAAGATRTPNWARKLTKNISLAPEIAQLHNQLSEATNKLQLEREYNRDLGKKHSHYANELKAERAYRQRLLDDHARLVQKLERDFDQRVRQLESQVRHEQDQSQVLNKGYGKIEKELKRAQDCARQLEDDHNRALQKLEKNFSERHRDLVDERDDATKALRKLQIQYDVSEEEHKKSQQRLEAESRAAERKSQDLVMKLRTLQEHAARNVESAQWMPQSVTETERQLNSILGAIKQWSEKRMRISKSGTSSCTNPAELDKDILQGLDMISVQEQDCPPVPLSTKLVLSAAVSTYAFRNIIGDVFFAFRNSMKTEQCADVYVGSNGEALTNIFEDIAKGDTAGANAWRCQLMRLLDPPSSNIPAMQETKTRAEQARNEATKILARKCLSQMQELIQEPSSDQVAQELHAIFRNCASLANNLAVQKMEVKVVGHGLLSPVYESGSMYMQPHGTHAADLEDDPRALDGNRVSLVVNPAIVVHGTTAGAEYEQYRVWKKATVMIES